MSAIQDVEFHAGETWLVRFVTHDADDNILPLVSGTDVQFRLSSIDSPVLTVSTDDAIVITDPLLGQGQISITPEMQDDAHIDPSVTYRYELRVQTPTLVSVQAEGKFKIKKSLFAE